MTAEMNASLKPLTLASDQAADQTRLEDDLEQKMQTSMVSSHVMPKNEAAMRVMYQSALDFFHVAVAGERHLWCSYPAYLVHFMPLFTFSEADWRHLSDLKQKSNEALESCHICITEYHSILSLVPMHHANLETPESLQSLVKDLDDLDAKRLVSTMIRFSEQDDAQLDMNLMRTIKLIVYEILAFPYLLRREAVYAQFCIVIHLMCVTRKKFQLKTILPGLLVCLFLPQRNIRAWSMMNFRKRIEEGDVMDPDDPVFKCLLAELHGIVSSDLLNMQQDAREEGFLPVVTIDGVHDRYKITNQATEFLQSLSLALSVLSTNAIYHRTLATDMLTDLIKYLAQRGTKADLFWPTLQAISVLITRFKSDLWKDPSYPSPTLLLDTIVSNVSLFESVFRTRVDSNSMLNFERLSDDMLSCSALLQCFCWMSSYLESLVEHDQFSLLFRRLILFLARDLVSTQVVGSVVYVQAKWYALSISLYFLRQPTSSQIVRMAFGDLALSHMLLSDLIMTEQPHPTLCHLSSNLVQACIEMDSLALYHLYMSCFDSTIVSSLKVSHAWTGFWLFLASVSPRCFPMHVHYSIMDFFSTISLMGAPKNDPTFRHLVAANQQREALGSSLVGLDAVINFLTLFLNQVERHCDNGELCHIYQDFTMIQAALYFTIHFDEGLRSTAIRLFSKVTRCSGRLIDLLKYFFQHARQHSLESVCHIFERYGKWTRMNMPMFCFIVRLSELACATFEIIFSSSPAPSPASLQSHPDHLTRLGNLFHSVWYFNFDVISKCFSTWKAFDKHERLPLMMATLALLAKQVQLYQSHALLVSVSRVALAMAESPEPGLSEASLDSSTTNAPYSFSNNGAWFPLLLECFAFAHRHDDEPMKCLLLELIQSLFQFWTHAKVEIDPRAVRYCKVFLNSRVAKLAESDASDVTTRHESKLEPATQDSFRKLCHGYEASLGKSLFDLSELPSSSASHSKWHTTPVAMASGNVSKFYSPVLALQDAKLPAQKKPIVATRKPASVPAMGSSQMNTGGKLQQIKSSILKDMAAPTMSNRVAHVPLSSLKRSSAVNFSKNEPDPCLSASHSDASDNGNVDDDDDDPMDSLVCSFKRKPDVIDLDDRSSLASSLSVTKNRLLERTAASKSIKIIDDPKVKRSATSIPYLAKKELPHSSSKIVTRALVKPPVSLDVSSFHRAILSWNYHELNDKNVSHVSHNKTLALSVIPDRFETYDQYAIVFEPLILFECRAQILKSKEELCYPSISNDYGIFHLNSVVMTDDFHDVQFGFDPPPPPPPTAASSSSSSDLSLSLSLPTSKKPLKGSLLEGFPFVEHDYLYLEPTELMSASVGTIQEGLCNSLFQPAIKTNKYVTAIVTGVGVKLGQVVLSVRMYIGSMDPRHVVSEFRDRTEWHVIKVCNLVTVYREYMALSLLPTYPLFPYIMDPAKLDKGSPMLAQELAHRVPHIASFFKVNESQALAIAASLHDPSPIVLVQGPPGTGKTTTILSMIGYHIGQSRSTRASASATTGGSKLTNTRVAHVATATSSMSSMDQNGRKPLLICAPSNAAVDEIVKRLIRDGIMVYDPNPARSASSAPVRIKPNVVRIGSLDMIHEDVKPYTLDSLMDKEATVTKSSLSRSGPEIVAVQEELTLLRRALDGLDGSGPRLELSPEEDIYGIANLKAPELLRRKKALQYMDTERRVTSKKTVDTARSTLRMKILNEADIICSTLSGSGHDLLAKWEGQSGLGFGIAFDTVIIDEACQCVELSSIIPLRYGAHRCILVGDPNQLPPTVLSQTAQGFAYEQSLFNRIQNVMPHKVYLLSIQYRMHPEISHFPSQYFYQGRLQNGPDLARTTQRDWHRFEHLRPFLFFHVPGNEARGTGTASLTSLMNAMEADMAVALVSLLCHACPQVNFASKIGIISPYKQQVREIKRRLLHSFRSKPHILLKHIDVSTVDGFQGQEKEIIIFSCVRASASGSIGFLNDARRMNVALTRAKCSLFVLGNANALNEYPIWRAMIQDATDKHQYVDYQAKFWSEQQSNIRPTNLIP